MQTGKEVKKEHSMDGENLPQLEVSGSPHRMFLKDICFTCRAGAIFLVQAILQITIFLSKRQVRMKD